MRAFLVDCRVGSLNREGQSIRPPLIESRVVMRCPGVVRAIRVVTGESRG